MTRSEFYEKIRQYESKWGKIGESKSIVHSAPETKEEPISCTEEYKQFRKKVAEGRNKDRLIHTTIISPEDLNARYHQELFDNNVLIHSNLSNAGKNVVTKNGKKWGESYYHKIDNYYSDGSARYFQTKEEYDAYADNKNNGVGNSTTKSNQQSSSDNAKGAGADYQRYLNAQNDKLPVGSHEGPSDGVDEKPNTSKKSQPVVDAKALVIEDNVTTQKSSSDNAKGKGREYDEYLKNNKNSTKPQQSYEDDLKETEKREQLANKREDQKSESMKKVGSNSNFIDEKAVEAEKKEREAKEAERRKEISKRNDAGREASIRQSQENAKARKEEAEREEQERNFNRNVEYSKNAEANRAYNEATNNTDLQRSYKNKQKEYKNVATNNDKTAEEFEKEFLASKGLKTEDDVKKYGVVKLTREINEAFDKEIARIKDRDRVKKNDQGREAAIKNSGPNVKSEGQIMADTAKKTLKANEDAARSREYDNAKYQAQNAGNKTISENRQENMLKDITAKGADPEQIAMKYGVSEDYVRELAYNAAGIIFENKLKEKKLYEKRI